MARIALALLAALAVVLAVSAGATAHPTNVLDRDHDTIDNPQDNCPDDYNRDQLDTDRDGRAGGSTEATEGGDACDTDDDGDTVDDAVDNCPLEPNKDQRDTDSDGIGDLCDDDDDADNVLDKDDRCVKVADPKQADADDDFIGDACDPEPGRRTPAPVAPGPAPGEAAPPAAAGRDPDDKTAPLVRVFGSRRLPLAAIRSGLPVELACSEACRVTATLRVGRRTLGRGDAAVGGAGATFVFVDVPRRSLGRLARARRVVLTLAVADPNGNATRITRTMRFRR